MSSWLRHLLLSAGLFACICLHAQSPTPPYRDPAQPLDARIEDLLARMTLEEKAGLMSNAAPGVPRLGIPRYDWWSEALHGVANAGHATVFPQAIGLAAMWNEELHQELAHVIGIEGRAKFNGYVGTPLEGQIFRGLTFWSPNINIFRDPRWGRGQETYGEDPFLTARLGVAFVQGLQGDHPDYLLAGAAAKHFAVHSGPEALRHDFDVSPTEADLYETYLPAFEALVREGRVEVVMTAYNALYGTPCSINDRLYSLLGEWGFDGHVTSDCGSVSDLHRTYQRAADAAEANALTMRAGMDLRCGNESAAVLEAVARGLVSEADVDRRVRPLLRTLFRLGLLDPPGRVPFNAIAPELNDAPAHGALALQAARESIVLLKNDGVLPLDIERVRRVAVIGPNATSVPALLGNYHGSPSAPVTILAGLQAALEPTGVRVDYAHGVDYAARPAGLRPHAGGWFHGEYFANPDLSGDPAARRTERPLKFDFAAGHSLPADVPERGVSIRWNGSLETTLPGDYELALRGRGGFRLKLGDETVIDAWTPPPGQAGAERQASVTRRLPGNAGLPLTLEYMQGEGPVSIAFEWRTPPVDAGVAEALALADSADLIVFVGGISAQLEGEEMQVDYEGFVGGDRESIELPAVQQALLEQLHATGKPIVFVNLSGSAVALPWADEHVNAILQAWYPGQAGGTAVADVLLGNYNPAGRLPVTFYRATADLPEFTDYRMADRTYRYFDGEPLYAFGHGLSYTTFEYANLRAEAGADGSIGVTVDITNTGERAGDEVVQIYATPPAATRPRERRALSGFDRVHLDAGATKTVEITVGPTPLRRWSTETKAYGVPAGQWTIAAGASSSDIRQSVTVDPTKASAPDGTIYPLEAPAEPRAIPLGTGGVEGQTAPESWFRQWGDPMARNVSAATLTPFLPDPDTANGAAVIVAPGGGFRWLSMGNEGWEVAEALAARGIAAFVLKYRLQPTPESLDEFSDAMNRAFAEASERSRPRDGEGRPSPPRWDLSNPLADAEAAYALIVERAAEWGVDTGRIGMIGFSAGAGLTLHSALHSTTMELAFIGPIYGGMGPVEVPADAPPMFAAIATDDFLFRGEFGVIRSWFDAGRPVEFHLYQNGGHGFGLGNPDRTSNRWFDAFMHWLEVNGWLAANATK